MDSITTQQAKAVLLEAYETVPTEFQWSYHSLPQNERLQLTHDTKGRAVHATILTPALSVHNFKADSWLIFVDGTKPDTRMAMRCLYSTDTSASKYGAVEGTALVRGRRFLLPKYSENDREGFSFTEELEKRTKESDDLPISWTLVDITETDDSTESHQLEDMSYEWTKLRLLFERANAESSVSPGDDRHPGDDTPPGAICIPLRRGSDVAAPAQISQRADSPLQDASSGEEEGASDGTDDVWTVHGTPESSGAEEDGDAGLSGDERGASMDCADRSSDLNGFVR